MSSLLQNDQLAWYIARSGGIVALILSAAAVIWGLLLSTKVLEGTPSPKWLLSLHRYLGTLSVVFTGVHVAGLVADNFVHFSWAETLIPFASTWQPGAVAWGIVSMYLLVAVQVSSMLMHKMPRRWWKRIHLLSYLMFWTGLVHGVQAGTDSGNPLYITGTATLGVLVVFLTAFRILTTKKQRPQRPRARDFEPTLTNVG